MVLRLDFSENYGDLRDFVQEYEDGKLTAEAKATYEAILENGPLDTLRLRREARPLPAFRSSGDRAKWESASADIKRRIHSCGAPCLQVASRRSTATEPRYRLTCPLTTV
jgi:hypothetical protein